MIRIGIESHIQLNTKSKLFCSCAIPTANEKPNTRTCPACLGLPGAKPSLNSNAITEALKVALALNCHLNLEFFFSRKSYFYNDLVNNFQITQYEIPIALQGLLENIRIRRVHLEEDPGRLVHEKDSCLIDYNRSGIPLIEVVTEPDFKSPNEVRLFLQKLTTILEYLNVYTRKSESTLKTDANISTDNGERVEIKNITGLKDIEKALNYEIIRQQSLLNTNQKVIRETRAWDPLTRATKSLRTKETEEDYGYIFDPNLTKIQLKKSEIEKIKSSLPELAYAKTLRFIKQYKLSQIDAKIISSDLKLANLFEEIIKTKKIPIPLAVKWLRRELLRVLKYNKLTLADTEISASNLIELLTLIHKKEITEQTAQRIIEKLIINPFSIKDYIKKQKLSALSSSSDIEKLCQEALKETPQAIKDYKSGQEKAFHFIVGKVMQKSRGAATPDQVNKILKKLIG